MKSLFVFFSDIHYTGDRPEQEGVILNAFMKDLQEQLKSLPHDETKFFIGGDLVQSADDNKYGLLMERVLSKIIPQERFNDVFIVPGNHDIQQSKVREVKETFFPLIDQQYDEEHFNNFIHSTIVDSLLIPKFSHFDSFVKSSFQKQDYSTLSYGQRVNDYWSVYCLNTSLLSSAALREDKGLLGANTRDLNEWLSHTAGKKILLMHHPMEWMMDWASSELRRIIQSDFDLVLSGHTHDQEILCNDNGTYSFVHCMSPKLSPGKDEELGYSIIEVENDTLEQVIYRKWSSKRRKFLPGSDFTEREDGKVLLQHSESIGQHVDPVELLYRDRLNESMTLYQEETTIWVDRFFSETKISDIVSLGHSVFISEQDIINNGKSVRIVAPPQYGLTCFAYHFLLSLWQQNREFGIYIDAKGIRSKKFFSQFNSSLTSFAKTKDDIKWIVVDNWSFPKNDRKEVLQFFDQNHKGIPIMLLTSFNEQQFDDLAELVGFLGDIQTLHMAPLKREHERQIVESFNRRQMIAEDEVVLTRLDEDLKNFNMHRTPFNCATLLTVFRDSWEETPINRTDVIERILRILFDSIDSSIASYNKTIPDVKDCEYCLGYLCKRILFDRSGDGNYQSSAGNGQAVFTSETFMIIVKECCESMSMNVDVQLLFNILVNSRILVEVGTSYTFRFSVWAYYFVAVAMINEERFASYMLSDQNYIHYPEVLEFYSGKDRKRKDAVVAVLKDLSTVIDSVVTKSRVPIEQNPFQMWRFKNNASSTETILADLEENVKNSNLPKAMKDSLADNTFNPSIAFDQQIYRVYSDFSVGRLMQLISISSKVLRNSEYVIKEDKDSLLDVIVKGWEVMSLIIYLVSKVFAKQGFILLQDYGLRLSDDFDKYTEEEKVVRIIVTIPFNLMMFFKEDIYSAKLGKLFITHFENESDRVKKHLLASLLVTKCPDGWNEAIQKYIAIIGPNSYYMGTLIDLMFWSLRHNELTPGDKGRMTNLMKVSLYKASNNVLPNSIRQIALHKIDVKEEDNESSTDSTK